MSVALDADKHISFQSSWGTNITEIADTAALGNPPMDPPLPMGFMFGGGGGTSNVYPLPGFQSRLGGQRRAGPGNASASGKKRSAHYAMAYRVSAAAASLNAQVRRGNAFMFQMRDIVLRF